VAISVLLLFALANSVASEIHVLLAVSVAASVAVTFKRWKAHTKGDRHEPG
jgi:hypothetical protein